MSVSSMTSIVNLGGGRQDRVKLAVQSEPTLPPKQPLLLEVAQNLPLQAVVRDICSSWNVEKPEQYALKYVDPPPDAAASAKFGYITEENRQKLKNGDILRIALTPPLQAKDTYDKIRSKSSDEKRKAIEGLTDLSKDYVFALEFIKLNGINSLMAMVEGGQLVNDLEIILLANLLAAFQELMEHSIVSWDALTDNFVKKLINFMHRSLNQESFRANVVSRSMAILESIVLNSPKFYNIVSREVSASQTIPFLERGTVEVKYNTLAFINAMVAKAPAREEALRELAMNRFNRVLQDAILNHFHGDVPQEIAHELYVFQCHVMNLVEGRMKTPFVTGDSRMEDDLRSLVTRAFPDDYTGKKNVPIAEQHWKQLGFIKGEPRMDFSDMPPGILALDCMVYFAKNKHESFTRLLFAHTDNQCPFAQTSVLLVKVLCQIFRIGEPPSDIGYEFIPVLVQNENPFKEVFCVAIQLLFKTWREMRASVLDLEKVVTVVTKQITTVMQASATINSFEALRQRLFDLSYKKIMESEDNSQLLDDAVIKSKPVQELCARIRPEIIELVKEERLRHLVEGQNFPRIGKKGRDQFFYCRLAPNHKVLHFGDTIGQQIPPIESLDKKIQVSEMRLEVGAGCPHASAVKKGTSQIFSVFYEGEEHLDFVAPNTTVFNIWVDGLSVLCGKKMPSKASEEDIDTLLNMDLKLRLLDIENVTIPSQPPVVPKEPTDYDFYYKLDN